MNRINPVTPDQAGPLTRLFFRIARRQMGGKLPEQDYSEGAVCMRPEAPTAEPAETA
jgi:hypothetical protein